MSSALAAFFPFLLQLQLGAFSLAAAVERPHPHTWSETQIDLSAYHRHCRLCNLHDSIRCPHPCLLQSALTANTAAVAHLLVSICVSLLALWYYCVVFRRPQVSEHRGENAPREEEMLLLPACQLSRQSECGLTSPVCSALPLLFLSCFSFCVC